MASCLIYRFVDCGTDTSYHNNWKTVMRFIVKFSSETTLTVDKKHVRKIMLNYICDIIHWRTKMVHCCQGFRLFQLIAYTVNL